MDFRPVWEKEDPYFVNEEGVKWWIDKDSTKFCKLDNHIIFVVQRDDYITRVIVDKRNNNIVYESQQLEGIGVMANIIQFLERTEK